MSWLRLLVLWIAMIAVPFQAYAAATMSACGSGHGAAGAAAVQPEHVEHEHGMRPLQDHDSSASPDPSVDPAHQCATCGACHATALTGLVLAAVLHDLPPADLAEPSFAMATRTPRVPDRPPRT